MVVMVILAATSIHHFSDRAFTLSKTSSPGTSRFYCPRPGLQSTKPNASVPFKTGDCKSKIGSESSNRGNKNARMRSPKLKRYKSESGQVCARLIGQKKLYSLAHLLGSAAR